MLSGSNTTASLQKAIESAKPSDLAATSLPQDWFHGISGTYESADP